MVKVSDASFRILCSKYGAGITFVEMLSATAIARKNKATLRLLDIQNKEKPIGVQLMGQKIEDIIKAIKIVEDKVDIIDFNLGCPVNNIVNQGAGAALLKRPNKVKEILTAMVSNSKKPVSVKIRSGWDKKSINAVEIAKIVENAGCFMISVHGKTKTQDRSSKSDWNIIRQVKENVSIPVVGNGALNSPEDVKNMFEFTNCDYVMLARAASKNPYIFKQIKDFLKNGKYEEIDDIFKLKIINEYLDLSEKYKPKFSYVKDHISYMTKDMVGSRKLRNEVSKTRSISEIKKILS